MRMRSICTYGTDAYAQGAHQFLTRTVCSAISMFLTRMLSLCMCVMESIFLITFKVPKTAKIRNIAIDTNKRSQKLPQQIFWPKPKKNLVKIRLSIRVRNFTALNEPLNIFFTKIWFWGYGYMINRTLRQRSEHQRAPDQLLYRSVARWCLDRWCCVRLICRGNPLILISKSTPPPPPHRDFMVSKYENPSDRKSHIWAPLISDT